MSSKGRFKVRAALGLTAAIALLFGIALATSPVLSQSLGVFTINNHSLEERGEREQAAVRDRVFPGKEKDDLVLLALDRSFPGKEKDDLLVPALDHHFPGKEADDLVVPVPDRHFPGKEMDDLVVTRS